MFIRQFEALLRMSGAINLNHNAYYTICHIDLHFSKLKFLIFSIIAFKQTNNYFFLISFLCSITSTAKSQVSSSLKYGFFKEVISLRMNLWSVAHFFHPNHSMWKSVSPMFWLQENLIWMKEMGFIHLSELDFLLYL